MTMRATNLTAMFNGAEAYLQTWEKAWAMRKNVSLVQLADNFMPFKWITLAK